jgi:hypothetical protein
LHTAAASQLKSGAESRRAGAQNYNVRLSHELLAKYIAPRRQERKENYFSIFSELGVLCVFARVISFPILQSKLHPGISNTFG